jgi:hypothetical protein
MATETFTVKKKSKSGKKRTIDLRKQLIEVQVLDDAQRRDLLDGDDVPIPARLQLGTICLKFTGAYSGAGGLSVDGMLKMLSASVGVNVEHLHSHRVSIQLREMTPPPPDKLWLANLCRTEAFMALDRRDPKMQNVGSNRGRMGGSFDDSNNPIDFHKEFGKK